MQKEILNVQLETLENGSQTLTFNAEIDSAEIAFQIIKKLVFMVCESGIKKEVFVDRLLTEMEMYNVIPNNQTN